LRRSFTWIATLLLIVALGACQSSSPTTSPPSTSAAGNPPPKVLAVESFLADIALNVAGDRLHIDLLIPLGADPHEYQPSPADVAKVADSQALIMNGAGLEGGFLEKLLAAAGSNPRRIEASAGLVSRTPTTGESDPHFWLDPILVIRYAENIRDGLGQLDPAGVALYDRNTSAYITQLRQLDDWIRIQVETLPPQKRLLVTNHESLGYFADRYGFRLVGTVIPSVSSDAAPSAQQLAKVVQQIRASGAPAVFLELGANPQLASQVAQEAGVRVVTGLYSETLSPPDGPASTYLAMMRYNTQAIVGGLR
jgi:ABC-type Zn uptake system ZnuABC Zn-binding protein ZnuA